MTASAPARAAAAGTSRPVVHRTALALAAAALLTGAAGCATTAPGRTAGAPGGDRVVQVVAAENFWGSIAAQLGGAHAHVTSVISNPATDPHDYEPTAADARAVSEARLAVVNGIGYDSWAGHLLSANPSGGRREVNVGDVTGVATGGNPHRWYSPDDVHRVIGAVTTAYQRLDPADRDYFAARRTAFEKTGLAGYHRLIDGIRDRWAGTPVGASESIVSPLAEGLGLKVLTPAALLGAISEGADPTARDKATADRQIHGRRIKVYVYNSQNSTPDVQRQVAEAKAAGIPLVTVTETLAPAGDSFQQWQTGQLERLRTALTRATGA